MRTETYEALRQLADRTEKDYGKLVQLLLGIAFLKAGAQQLVTRAIQGMDIEFTLDDVACCCEVKTCEKDGKGKIKLGKKDIDGLADQAVLGRKPLLAALGGRRLDDLLLLHVPVGELVPDTYSLIQLRALRDHELEQRVRPCFEKAINLHTATALEGGQAALNKILESYEEWRPA